MEKRQLARLVVEHRLGDRQGHAGRLHLEGDLAPTSGKGATMTSSSCPDTNSGQRLASLKSAMVSRGEAVIWTLRRTIAIVDLLALCCVVPLRDPAGPIGCGRPDRTVDEHRRSRQIARFSESSSTTAPLAPLT